MGPSGLASPSTMLWLLILFHRLPLHRSPSTSSVCLSTASAMALRYSSLQLRQLIPQIPPSTELFKKLSTSPPSPLHSSRVPPQVFVQFHRKKLHPNALVLPQLTHRLPHFLSASSQQHTSSERIQSEHLQPPSNSYLRPINFKTKAPKNRSIKVSFSMNSS